MEVPPRRRIFLPIGRVRSSSAGQVVVSGLVNLRRFEKRAAETLVIGELLDRTVRTRETDEKVQIVDVKRETAGIRVTYRVVFDTNQYFVAPPPFPHYLFEVTRTDESILFTKVP